MTAKRICRTMTLATVLLTAGLASSGCGVEDERLTSPTKPTANLTPSSLPTPYTWEFTWTGSPSYCAAGWSWQLSDSSWVSEPGVTGCGAQPSPMSGTGTVPVNAIALRMSAEIQAGGCDAFNTVTKTLNNNQSLSATVNAQLPSLYIIYDPFTGTRTKVKCPSLSASLSIRS